MEDGTLERFAVALGGMFSNVGVSGDDAVCVAVEKLLKMDREGRAVADHAGWIYAVARNELRAAWREQQRLVALPEDEALEAPDDVPEQVIGEDLFRRVRDAVSAWENRNQRVVMLVLLDAAYNGEPRLTRAELVEAASEALGRELSSGSVGQWRRRGVARIQQQFGLELDIDDQEPNHE